jgi:hypothetical protein
MIKHNQNGSTSSVLIFSLLVVLLLGALGFGSWAFMGKQDYKNNTDAKIAAAVVVANKVEDAKQAALYAEAAKNPLRTYNGPEAYGSIVVNYPKTWSGYVDATGNGSAALDGYFAPSVVPSISDQASVFALRVQVINQSYAQSVQAQTATQQNATSVVTAYSLPKVPSAVGVKVTGALSDNKSGVMVILPLRDKTLEISTYGSAYVNDFNTYILPNFSFSP